MEYHGFDFISLFDSLFDTIVWWPLADILTSWYEIFVFL